MIEPSTGLVRQLSDAAGNWIYEVTISGNGHRIAWVEDFSTIKVFDLDTSQVIAVPAAHSRRVRDVRRLPRAPTPTMTGKSS